MFAEAVEIAKMVIASPFYYIPVIVFFLFVFLLFLPKIFKKFFSKHHTLKMIVNYLSSILGMVLLISFLCYFLFYIQNDSDTYFKKLFLTESNKVDHSSWLDILAIAASSLTALVALILSISQKDQEEFNFCSNFNLHNVENEFSVVKYDAFDYLQYMKYNQKISKKAKISTFIKKLKIKFLALCLNFTFKFINIIYSGQDKIDKTFKGKLKLFLNKTTSGIIKICTKVQKYFVENDEQNIKSIDTVEETQKILKYRSKLEQRFYVLNFKLKEYVNPHILYDLKKVRLYLGSWDYNQLRTEKGNRFYYRFIGWLRNKLDGQKKRKFFSCICILFDSLLTHTIPQNKYKMVLAEISSKDDEAYLTIVIKDKTKNVSLSQNGFAILSYPDIYDYDYLSDFTLLLEFKVNAVNYSRKNVVGNLPYTVLYNIRRNVVVEKNELHRSSKNRILLAIDDATNKIVDAIGQYDNKKQNQIGDAIETAEFMAMESTNTLDSNTQELDSVILDDSTLITKKSVSPKTNSKYFIVNTQASA